MTQHAFVASCAPPRDKKRIMEVFGKYQFMDEYGHPLTQCLDFLQLVNAYCSEHEKAHEDEATGHMNHSEINM